MTNFLPPVPKPTGAGSPRPAIASTRMAFANVRSGPGTRYRTVGDLRNNALILHFPATRTGDGWEWVEVGRVHGWVSTNVVNFQPVATTPKVQAVSTPFDQQQAIWHERGDALADPDIETFASNLKQHAPNISQVWVKACDWSPLAGVQWMGYWDTHRGLAVDGLARIDEWGETLADFGLQLCLWVTPFGADPVAEAELIARACSLEVVRALIIDLKPSDMVWNSDPSRIALYLSQFRSQVGDAFHIGISFDATRTPSKNLHLGQWIKYANSLHPRIFPARARKTATAALRDVFTTVKEFDKPVIPCLAGDADPVETSEAVTYRHDSRGRLAFNSCGHVYAKSLENACRAACFVGR